jgi:hypothetical protein
LGTRTELLVPQPLVELALLGFTLFAGGVVRADLKMALCSAPVRTIAAQAIPSPSRPSGTIRSWLSATALPVIASRSGSGCHNS